MIDEGFAFGPEWSAYRWDTRVAWDRLPGGVLAAVIDPIDSDASSRLVMHDLHQQIVVKGAVNEGASLRDEGDRYNQRLRVFESVDAAIAAVIGDPWELSVMDTPRPVTLKDDGTAARAYVVPKYLGHVVYEELFIGPNHEIYRVYSDYPHPGGVRVRPCGAPYQPDGPEQSYYGSQPDLAVWKIVTWEV